MVSTLLEKQLRDPELSDALVRDSSAVAYAGEALLHDGRLH